MLVTLGVYVKFLLTPWVSAKILTLSVVATLFFLWKRCIVARLWKYFLQLPTWKLLRCPRALSLRFMEQVFV